MRKIILSFNLEKANESVNTSQLAVFLQALLMEMIDNEVAEYLHQPKIKPYSQYIEKKPDSSYYWTINLLDDEINHVLGDVIMDSQFNSFKLRALGNQTINVISKNEQILEVRELTKEFYVGEAPKRLKIQFLTPTSFKQNEVYVLFPDIHLIIQSLMTKYGDIIEGNSELQEDLLDDLTRTTRIRNYNLRSQTFRVHQKNIQGFVGNITIDLFGNETMRRYLYMLFKFGMYSGVGIKSAMGMGAINVQVVERKGQVE